MLSIEISRGRPLERLDRMPIEASGRFRRIVREKRDSSSPRLPAAVVCVLPDGSFSRLIYDRARCYSNRASRERGERAGAFHLLPALPSTILMRKMSYKRNKRRERTGSPQPDASQISLRNARIRVSLPSASHLIEGSAPCNKALSRRGEPFCISST